MTARQRVLAWTRSLRIRRYAERQQRAAAEQRNAEERDELRAKGVMKSKIPPSGGMGF